jgi:hypothetical protein
VTNKREDVTGEWTRVNRSPSFGSGWRCGPWTITDEVLHRLPQEECQRVAVEMAGVQLPADEVWPPQPEPPLFRTVAEMEAAVRDLLSRPREAGG